jgi:hypothetical protein
VGKGERAMIKRSDDYQLREHVEDALRALTQYIVLVGIPPHQSFYLEPDAVYNTAKKILNIVDTHDKGQRKEASNE